MGNEVTVVPKENAGSVRGRKKRQAFIAALAQTAQVMEAAKAAGFTDTSALQKFRRENEDFAEEWDHALEAATDLLVDEAVRRAKDGVHEPQYYKGEIVGYTIKHSDAMLMFLIRGARPDTYRENARGGETNINFGIAVLPMTAPNEGDWQDRALLMHSKQQPITIDAKPVENQMAKITRGD